MTHITKSLLLAAALTVASEVSAATIVQNSGSVDVTLSGLDAFTFDKFDVNQGTLTGVKFELLTSVAGGTIQITTANITGRNITFSGATSHIIVEGPGVNISPAATTLSFTSPSLPNNQAKGTTVNYNASSANLLTSGPVTTNVGSLYFADYSANGYDTLSIAAALANVYTMSFSTFPSMNTTGFKAPSTARLTYTYTPVPEASTYGIALGGLALAGALIRRRRQAK